MQICPGTSPDMCCPFSLVVPAEDHVSVAVMHEVTLLDTVIKSGVVTI